MRNGGACGVPRSSRPSRACWRCTSRLDVAGGTHFPGLWRDTGRDRRIDQRPLGAGNVALALTYDPSTKASYALLPPDSGAVTGPPGLAVVTARYTRGDYDAAIKTVFEEWVAGRAGRALGASIDAKTGRVRVLTTSPQTAFSPAIARLGDIVWVQHDSQLGAASGPRSSDSAPHWGGGRINRAAGVCSAGPNILVGGTAYGTTAGHCGPNGTAWNSGSFYHGYINSRPDYQLTGATPIWSTDVARITNSTWAPRIYQGGTTTTASVLQVGSGDPVGGSPIWTSGQTSGSQSGSVVDTSFAYCDSEMQLPLDGLTGGVCFNNLYTTSSLVQSGDSGGVCHTRSGDVAGVRGVISGRVSGGGICLRWSRVAAILGASIQT